MSVTIIPRRKSILELDLTTPPASPDPDDLIARLRARNQPQLRPILRALHDAGADPAVRGLVAKVGPPLSWAMTQELRAAVRAFAASGKPTVAWAETFGEGNGAMSGYVLATAFDEIWLQPGGELGLLGVAAEVTFLRGALDRLGIEPQLEQRYEYKNAANQVMRAEFTDAHRESLDRITASVFDDAVAAIGEGRRLDAARVRELVDTGPRTAVEAHDAGLVDQLGYRDQVLADVERRADGAQRLFADRWQPRRSAPSLRPGNLRRKGHVALVELRGGIGLGHSRRGPMGRQSGSDNIAAALRAAGRDEHARAVLFHVDSPGGSAVASDTIWREVTRLREAGKPVIVSMGDAAASGGYYVACPADVIVALPATLTGSIGVFGGKIVTERLLERVGLTTGAVQHGARARMFSSRRPFDEDEQQRLAASIDAIYADFVAKVADGRGRAVAEIEPIARGRVWTGRDALGVGLVDELGGRRDALRIARARGGLPDDAPLRPALRVPPLARLGRARNSDDPRASLRMDLPGLADVHAGLCAALGLPAGAELRLPPISLR